MIFLVMEYVDSSKRTLVGNIGLAICLTLSGVYQPMAMKYEVQSKMEIITFLLQVPWRLESFQLGHVQSDWNHCFYSSCLARVRPVVDE